MLRRPGAKTGLLGIDRVREHGCAVLAARAGAGAPVVAFVEEHGALLTRFIEGAAALTPETAADPGRLGRIVAAIRSYHEGPAFPGRFDPFATVRAYHGEALRHGVVFPSDLGRTLARMEEWESALGPHAEVRPCHNDLLPGNLLDDGRRIWIVDWEYAGNGDLFFDLGNFAVNLELDGEGCAELAMRYFGRVDGVQLAQLHLMRGVSDLREAFWGYLQSGISALEFDFAGYAARHLQRFRAHAADEESAAAVECLRREAPVRTKSQLAGRGLHESG
jgi:thiamine kinase-like enzyme